MASPVLIKYLNDVKYSFNSYTMDRITIEAATAAVKDRAYFEETTAKVIKTREWTKKELKRLGFTFCDSKSNLYLQSLQMFLQQSFLRTLRQTIYLSDILAHLSESTTICAYP